MCQTQLRGGQLLTQHRLRLGDRIRQHNIRAEPEVHLVGLVRVDGGAGVESVVELEAGLERVGGGVAAALEEGHHLQRLFDVRDLVAQADGAVLCVHLHELVLGDHLLEVAERLFDVGAGGDVVGDIVDEGGDGDAAGVRLGGYSG